MSKLRRERASERKRTRAQGKRIAHSRSWSRRLWISIQSVLVIEN